MNGYEFLERVERCGKRMGLPVRFDPTMGKGSHGTLFIGARRTTLKDRRKELGAGLLASMLRDLGLTKTDLR